MNACRRRVSELSSALTLALTLALSSPLGVGAVGGAMLLPSAASAHSYLQGSEPPNNARIAESPSEIRLHFSAAVETRFVRVEIRRGDQPLVPEPAVVIDDGGRTLRIKLAPAAAGDTGAGSYQVLWRIVAKDGHPTQGRVNFEVRAPASR